MSASVKPRLAGRQPSTAVGCPGWWPGPHRMAAGKRGPGGRTSWSQPWSRGWWAVGTSTCSGCPARSVSA